MKFGFCPLTILETEETLIWTFLFLKYPKTFWSQFVSASGVYTVGEAFDGDMKYVGGYVGSLDGVLNYPFFFTIRDIF